jgi:type IV pilus assembly protein PilC
LTVLSAPGAQSDHEATDHTLAENVQTGSHLLGKSGQFPRIFNKLYVNMVKAGELGGVLEIALNRLAEYQEKAQKLKNKVVAAMVYPIIVMFIAVAIMVFLMLVIVPKFEKIFEDMLGSRDKLPGSQNGHRIQSTGCANHLVPRHFGRCDHDLLEDLLPPLPKGRRIIDDMKLKLPLFGDVQRKTAISRFTRTLGTLVTSGVPILQALNITRETAGNVVVSNAINQSS